MEAQVIIKDKSLQGIMGNVVGNVVRGIRGDQIIKVLDCHTKELEHYSVDNRKLLKGFWR